MFEHSTNGTSRDARAAAGVRRTSPRPLGPATGLLQRFSGEARGTTAVLFALSAVPLFAVIGASMDYAQALRAQTQLQRAADAALVGAFQGWSMTEAQRVQLALDLFRSNVRNHAATSDATSAISIVQGSASLSSEHRVDTSFLRIVGIDTITIGAAASVVFTGKKIELALMADITGSMSEYRSGAMKLDGLKLAARDMLEIVLPDGGTEGAARVSLIPFANVVNAGSRATAATGLSPTRVYNGVTQHLITCVTERTGTNAYTDAAPGPSAYVGASNQGHTTENYDSEGGCDRSNSSATLPEVMPLTADKRALLAQIDSFTPGGSTAGHLGTAWAWYTIAPAWSSFWGLSTPVASYSDREVLKAVVLMTDGEYNTQYSTEDSKTQAMELCRSMKAAGVTVFTVGFGFASSGDSVARDTLTQCASGTGHYFFPYDGEALRTAFIQIGQQLSALGGSARLVN